MLRLAVTSLNMDGFEVRVKTVRQFVADFSASKHCIQLKLPQVTFIVYFLTILPINQHHVKKNIKKIYDPTSKRMN